MCGQTTFLHYITVHAYTDVNNKKNKIQHYVVFLEMSFQNIRTSMNMHLSEGVQVHSDWLNFTNADLMQYNCAST